MLKIINRESILWPVRVHVPRDEGPTTDEHLIKVRYRLLSMEQLKEVRESDQNNIDFVKDNITDWQDIADENGPLEFNRTNLDRVMNIPYLARAISDTFWEAQRKATEKN